MIQPKIKSVFELQGWFTQANKPAWVLYAGSRFTDVSKPIAVNYEVLDTSGAWSELQTTLRRFDNIGTYSLLVKSGKKSSSDAQTIIIELNPNYQPQQQGINGIGNPYYQIQGQKQQGYNEFSHEVKEHIDRQVREKLSMERRLMQSEFDMKQIKLSIGQTATTTDKLVDAFVKNPNGILLGLSGFFGNKKTPQTAQLGVLSDDSKVPPVQEETPQTAEEKKPQQPPQKAITKTLDFNKVTQGAIVLFNLGIKDIDEIIYKMALTAQKSPDEAIQKINMLKSYL